MHVNYCHFVVVNKYLNFFNLYVCIICSSSPMASGIVKISLKIIAASKSYLLTGCRVTSVANLASRQILKKSCFCRNSLNSGRCLPACRMIQIGILSGVSPLAARRRLSFCKGAKLLMFR